MHVVSLYLVLGFFDCSTLFDLDPTSFRAGEGFSGDGDDDGFGCDVFIHVLVGGGVFADVDAGRFHQHAGVVGKNVNLYQDKIFLL